MMGGLMGWGLAVRTGRGEVRGGEGEGDGREGKAQSRRGEKMLISILVDANINEEHRHAMQNALIPNINPYNRGREAYTPCTFR